MKHTVSLNQTLVKFKRIFVLKFKNKKISYKKKVQKRPFNKKNLYIIFSDYVMLRMFVEI